MATVFERWAQTARELKAAKATPEQAEAAREELRKRFVEKMEEAKLDSATRAAALSRFESGTNALSVKHGLKKETDPLTEDERYALEHPVLGGITQAGKELVAPLAQGAQRIAGGAARLLNDIGDNDKGTVLDRFANNMDDAQRSVDDWAGQGYAEADGVRGFAKSALQNSPQIALSLLPGAALGKAAALAKAAKGAQAGDKVLKYGMPVAAGLSFGQNYAGEYGDARKQTEDKLAKATPDDLRASNVYGSDFKSLERKFFDDGMSADDAATAARDALVDSIAERRADAAAIINTGLEFVAPGAMAVMPGFAKTGSKKMASDLALAGKMASGGRLGSKAANLSDLKDVGLQFLQEGLQGGVTERAAEGARANAFNDKIDYGSVLKSAALEAAAGGIIGGASQMASGGTSRRRAQDAVKEAQSIREQYNSALAGANAELQRLSEIRNQRPLTEDENYELSAAMMEAERARAVVSEIDSMMVDAGLPNPAHQSMPQPAPEAGQPQPQPQPQPQDITQPAPATQEPASGLSGVVQRAQTSTVPNLATVLSEAIASGQTPDFSALAQAYSRTRAEVVGLFNRRRTLVDLADAGDLNGMRDMAARMTADPQEQQSLIEQAVAVRDKRRVMATQPQPQQTQQAEPQQPATPIKTPRDTAYEKMLADTEASLASGASDVDTFLAVRKKYAGNKDLAETDINGVIEDAKASLSGKRDIAAKREAAIESAIPHLKAGDEVSAVTALADAGITDDADIQAALKEASGRIKAEQKASAAPKAPAAPAAPAKSPMEQAVSAVSAAEASGKGVKLAAIAKKFGVGIAELAKQVAQSKRAQANTRHPEEDKPKQAAVLALPAPPDAPIPADQPLVSRRGKLMPKPQADAMAEQSAAEKRDMRRAMAEEAGNPTGVPSGLRPRVEAPARAPQKAVLPNLILRTDGKPFPDAKQANRVLARKKLADTHEVVSVEGGKAIAPKDSGKESAIDETNRAFGDWYRANKSSMSEELTSGGILDGIEFRNLPADIRNRSAHGMAKDNTLRSLRNLLNNGIDTQTEAGGLFTATLSPTHANAGAGSGTASGSAYTDGPFILVGKPGVGKITDISQIDAIVVNQALPDGVLEGLQNEYPDFKFVRSNTLESALSQKKTAPGTVSNQSGRTKSTTSESTAPTKKSNAKNQVDPEKDDILAAIAKAGGVNWDQARKQGGFDPAESGRRGSGILRVFKKSGGMTLDGMAEHLSQFGYPVTDENGDYTVNALLDAMDAALRGGQVGTAQFNERLAREMHEQEAEWRSLDDAFDGKSSGSVPAWLDDGADALVESVIDGEAQPSAVMADALNEVENERTIASPTAGTGQKADAQAEAGSGQGGNAPAAGRRESGQQEGQVGTGQDQGAQGFQLTAQSEAERLAEEQRQAADLEAKRNEEESARLKAQADRELSSFTLTGSDRPADVAMAAGQNDLFGPKTRGEREAENSYAERNTDRIRRIGEASTKDQVAKIVSEEESDPERHFEGTSKVSNAAHTRHLGIDSAKRAENERAALDRGEKVDVAGQRYQTREDAERAAREKNDEGDGYTYEPKVISDEDSHTRYVLTKRKAASTGAKQPREMTDQGRANDAATDAAESKPEPVREMTEEGRAKDGKPIIGGDKFRTSSGRETTTYPHQKSEKYASQWLIDNATAEAEARGDDFNAPIFRRTTLLKNGMLAGADRDSMLMYLFGEQPKVVPSILKPLTEGGGKEQSEVTSDDHLQDAGGAVAKEPMTYREFSDDSIAIPTVPDAAALALAKEVMSGRFEESNDDTTEMNKRAMAAGIPRMLTFVTDKALGNRSLISIVADQNLRDAPTEKIQGRIDSITKKINQSMEKTVSDFDPSTLGGSGAAGRQRDRARASEARGIMGEYVKRLQEELERRGVKPETASEVFGKEKQREAQKQAENKPPREQLIDEVADAIRSAEDSGLKETASRLHNLTQDLHDRTDTPENGRKRLETILHDMKNPILSGEWVSLGKGRTVFRWEGMDYGRIEDTRITEDRSSSVSDPWKTSDGQTHATLRDAKRHELAANSRQRLIRDGYMTDESAADQSKAEESAKPGTITDFGEKIGGARKDVWQSYEKSLSDELPDDASEIKLSKHFPEPDYDAAMAAGVPEESLAAVKAMRDEIPAKPQKSWKVKQWADKVRVLREFAADIMSGKVSVDNIKQKMREAGRLMDGFANRIELYKEVGYPRFTRMQGKNIEHAVFNMFKGETRPGGIPKYVLSEAGKGDRYYDTRQQALDALKGILDSELNAGATARTTKLDIYRVTSTGDIIIGKKVAAGKYIDLKTGFKSPREAHEYLAAHQDELMAELGRKKETKPERKAVNDPRQGEDYRKGEDVTPEKFSNTFGFRGVEFGNYVEGARRQQDLNNAYDALLDLATILNVPPKALSLNGSLGLAFGARGSGGKGAAAAHFEPSKVVINLTKGNGAGSLAHEWFHALDNYFSRARGQETGHISDSPHPKMVAGADRKLVEDTRVRKEVLDAWKGVMDAIRKSGMVERSKQLDTRKSKDYWSTPHELTARAFEKYIIDRAAEKQASNDYLANVLPEEFFDKEDPTPYPTNNEAVKINAAYQKLFDTMKHEVTDKGVKLYSTADTSGPGLTTSRAREILSADPVLSKALPFIDIRNSREGVPEGAEPMYLPAWHGSPFKFDKFSLEHLGKGEGVQAYGWGLYFTGSKGIAEYYRNTLSSPNIPDGKVLFNGVMYDYSGADEKSINRLIDAVQSKYGFSRRVAAIAIMGMREHGGATMAKTYFMLNMPNKTEEQRNASLLLTVMSNEALDAPSSGALYKVDIPEEGSYLLWDAPMSKQGGAVKDALLSRKADKYLKKYAQKNRNLFEYLGETEMSGRDIYEALSIGLGSPEKASKFLGSMGISGIKFLDGASRSKGEGNHNYVVFDDAAVRILETYYSAGDAGAEGYYHNGRITLFADNIRATGSMSAEERLKWVAFHEITHRGVANLAESQAYLSELERAGKNPYVKNLAKKIYEARQSLDAKYHVSMEVATEEALAEINAALRTGNVKQIKEQYGLHFPLSIRPRAKSAAARFIEAVKRIINRMFGRGLTDAQVENLLRRTNDAGMTPDGGPGRGKDYDATVFSLADNGDGSPTEAALAEARRQLEEQLAIADRMIAERGGLFAPNGEKSKLSRYQWAQVRTASFKRWFGDWEGDPGNASSVVDDNGEPKIVYHSGDSGLTEIRKSGRFGGIFVLPTGAPRYRAQEYQFFLRGEALSLDDMREKLDSLDDGGLSIYQSYLSGKEEATDDDVDSITDALTNGSDYPDDQRVWDILGAIDEADAQVEIQRLRGKVAAKLGYGAVQTPDEHGMDTIMVTDSKQIKSATGNAGTFSGKTDDIRYSPSPKDWITEQGRITKRVLSKEVAQRDLTPWQKTLGTQLNAALKNPAFKKVYDLTQRLIQHINNDAYDSLNAAPDVLSRLEDWNDYKRDLTNTAKEAGAALTMRQSKRRKDMAAAAEVLFEGTRFDKKVYSDKELDAFKLTADQKEIYRQARAAIDKSVGNAGKSQALNVAMNAEAINWETVERLVNMDLEPEVLFSEVSDLIDTRIAATKMEAENSTNEAEIKKLDKQVEKLSAALASIGEIQAIVEKSASEGYAPLMRWGKYTVAVIDPVDGKTLRFHMLESKREQAALELKLREKYGAANVVGGVLDEGKFEQFKGITPETVALFASVTGMDQDAAYQEYLKLAIPGRSALKRKIHRKGDMGEGIEGFSTDLPRVLSSFVLSNARKSARDLYRGPVNDAIEGIKVGGGVAAKARELAKFVMEPDENDWSVGIRNLLFVWNMGASVAFGALNLSQPWMMTLPWLSQFQDPASAAGVMAKAAKLAASAQASGKAPKGYEAEYSRAVREGIVDPQNVFMLQGVERGKSGVGTNIWRNVAHGMGLIASATESMNRKLTLIAALDVARAKGDAWLKSKGFADAYDFAARSVAETQGIYNKGNRPAWARSPVGAVLLVFKQYSINWVEMASRMASNHYGDDRYRKGFWMLVGALFMMAGGMGLPGVGDMIDMIETSMSLAGKPVNVERQMQMALGKDLYEPLMYGPVNSLLFNPMGADMFGRMSMGNMIPATAVANPGLTWAARSDEAVQALGAGAGLASKFVDAYNQAASGNVGQALITASPRAVTSIAKAVEMATTNQYKDSKGRTVRSVTPAEALIKGLDLQPASVARIQRERSRRFKDEAIQAQAKETIRNELIDAYESGDQAAIDEANNRLRTWNNENPLYPVHINRRALRKTVRERGKNWSARDEAAKGMEWMNDWIPESSK